MRHYITRSFGIDLLQKVLFDFELQWLTEIISLLSLLTRAQIEVR